MVEDRKFIFHPQRGGSVSDLFTIEDRPFVRDDGVTIQMPATVCRWCRAATTAKDEEGFDEADYQPANYAHKLKHVPPCGVQDWLATLKHDGQTSEVVEEYDRLIDYLDDADNRDIND
jgi:hypothetical protein